MHSQAISLASDELMLTSYYHNHVINHASFESALAFHVAAELGSDTVSEQMLNTLFTEVLRAEPSLADAALADIDAYFERDPACDNYCRPFLFFKGYLAIQAQRFAHYLWSSQRRSMARYIQHGISVLCDVDIHPAAQLGKGLMVDHATGLVIGETAVVGNNVSLLHGVTLGGTGNGVGKRHPKIGEGVLISSGAKILGDITVGDGAKVGAGSVVLESVPAHVTVAGVPAKVVGRPVEKSPSLSMDQQIDG
jgi:serine O-acetyltransferase|tara:strand:- start:1136 stop:1888 length:753 start_codon:yes stop_codon:yes gene_type:complete